MRSAFLLVLVACGTTETSSKPAPVDAPWQFTFTADYMLDSTITAAYVGSASYGSGDTIHVDIVFASYAASQQGSGLAVQVVSGSGTGVFAIKPDECLGVCAIAHGETLSASVSWANGLIVTDEGGYCDSPGNACGWAD